MALAPALGTLRAHLWAMTSIGSAIFGALLIGNVSVWGYVVVTLLV